MEPKESARSPRGGGAGQATKTAGGATATATEVQVKEDRVQEPLVLRLEPRPHVKWEQDVVDNEHMNKRSSKRCCIFHKRREFGESSSESDSDGGPGHDHEKRIAQPKQPPVKPHETYHA